MNSQIDINVTHSRGWQWFRWRGAILAVVFLMGFVAFSSGVEVSDRDVRPDARGFAQGQGDDGAVSQRSSERRLTGFPLRLIEPSLIDA